MKRMIYKLSFSLIIMIGLLIGMVKGQEVKHKWMSKMKNRYEEKRAAAYHEVLLDEIELSTYHS